MTRRDCLTPPPDGTREREIVDRFADFLAEAPRPSREAWLAMTPARRYRVRFLAWRLEQVPR